MRKRNVRAEDMGLRKSLKKARKRLDYLRKEILRKKNRDPRWKF
jgi:hypothetical protein